MKNFKALKIWQKGMDLTVNVYRLAFLLPFEERFGLRSQISRAAVSIPSNIAEGSSRSSEKDYNRYLEMALGSSFELETQLFLIKRLGMVDETKVDKILATVEEEQRMMSGFMKSLKL